MPPALPGDGYRRGDWGWRFHHSWLGSFADLLSDVNPQVSDVRDIGLALALHVIGNMEDAVQEDTLAQLIIGGVTGAGWPIPSLIKTTIHLGRIILYGVEDEWRHGIDEHGGDAPVANFFFAAVTPMLFIRYFVPDTHVKASLFARRNAEISKPFFSLFGQEDRAIRIGRPGVPWRRFFRDDPGLGNFQVFFHQGQIVGSQSSSLAGIH